MSRVRLPSGAGSLVHGVLGSSAALISGGMGGTKVASGLTPPVASGLRAWFRADTGVTNSSGHASAWADQSGTGDTNKNLAQGTGAAQPTINAANASFNNQATLDFDSGDYMVSGTWTSALAQPATVFFCGKTLGAGGVYYIFDGLNANEMNAAGVSGYSAIQAGALLFQVPDFGSTPFVGAGLYNGGSSKIYNNALTAIITGAAGAGGLTGMTVGADYTGASKVTGSIAEILVYSGALSAPDFATVMNYLGTRYGITIGA